MTAPGRARLAAAIGLPVMAFLIVYSAHVPDVPLLPPDAAGYLEFATTRTGGYPFFLAALEPFTTEVADYALIQRLVYAVSVLVLGWQIARSTGSAAIAFVAELALLFCAPVNRLHFTILTESLFLSVSALFIATTLAHLRYERLWTLALASMLAAYAYTIRPTGIAFLPAVAILAFSAAKPTHALAGRIAALSIPAVAIVALEGAYFRAHHAESRESLLPIVAFARAGLVDVEPAQAAALIEQASPAAQPLQRALEALAPVRRIIADAPSTAARCRVLSSYENFLYWRFPLDERPREPGSQAVLGEAAWQRLRHALADYAGLTATHLFCLWSLTAIDDAGSAALAAYFESNRPLPFDEAVREEILGAPRPPFPNVVGAAMAVLAAVLTLAVGALVVMVLTRRQVSIPLAAAGLCGLIVHGGLLLAATFSVGAPRYVFGLWVPLAIGVGMGALWIYGQIRDLLGRSKLV